MKIETANCILLQIEKKNKTTTPQHQLEDKKLFK